MWFNEFSKFNQTKTKPFYSVIKPCKFIAALIVAVFVTINTLILRLEILQSKVVIYNDSGCDLLNCCHYMTVCSYWETNVSSSKMLMPSSGASSYINYSRVKTKLCNWYIYFVLIHSEWCIKMIWKISILLSDIIIIIIFQKYSLIKHLISN